jgi:hypothetical protein
MTKLIMANVHVTVAYTSMGSDRANRGPPNPNGPNGGPQGQVVEQKHWASDMSQCRIVVF